MNVHASKNLQKSSIFDCISFVHRPEQMHYYVSIDNESNKSETLVDILKLQKKYTSIAVFCNTKSQTENIYNCLRDNKFSVGVINYKSSPEEMVDLETKFISQKLDILVLNTPYSYCISVAMADLVINVNYVDPTSYSYRAGRGSKVARKKTCISLVVFSGKGIPPDIERIQNENCISIDALTMKALNATY
jgi:ATP-dependent RNA helicase DeaD